MEIIIIVLVVIHLLAAAYFFGSFNEAAVMEHGSLPVNMRLTNLFFALIWPYTIGWMMYDRLSGK